MRREGLEDRLIVVAENSDVLYCIWTPNEKDLSKESLEELEETLSVSEATRALIPQ